MLDHRATIVVKFWYLLFRSYQSLLLSVEVFLDFPLYKGFAQFWFLIAATATISILH